MNALHHESMNTPAPSQAASQAPANASGSDDLLALIRAVRLMWKHKGWIALGTFLFTARTIR